MNISPELREALDQGLAPSGYRFAYGENGYSAHETPDGKIGFQEFFWLDGMMYSRSLRHEPPTRWRPQPPRGAENPCRDIPPYRPYGRLTLRPDP